MSGEPDELVQIVQDVFDLHQFCEFGVSVPLDSLPEKTKTGILAFQAAKAKAKIAE